MTEVSSNYASTLSALRDHQSDHPLAILPLADAIITSTRLQQQRNDENTTQQRNSDASNSSASEHLNPANLAADLQHYRDLFSKLRFSYLEQVTKEKYLRGIVGDPPILVSHQDNVLLEEELAVKKAGLKAKKQEVEDLVKNMEHNAKELASKFDQVESGTREMERLVPEVRQLEERKAELDRQLDDKRMRFAQTGEGADSDGGEVNPRMQLSLAQTEELVQQRARENQELDTRIAELQRQLPAKMRECETAEKDLEMLERRRDEAAAMAREARRVKEEGGRDRVEELGRWYRSVEVVMGGMGVSAGEQVDNEVEMEG